MPQPRSGTDEAQICLAELSSAGADFSALPDIAPQEGCFARNSVQVARVGGDMGSRLQVSGLSRVSCPTARSFAAWVRYGVDRAARQYLGSPVVRIETFGSYSCRNVAGSSRRSAHSRAEAVDVSGFVLADGRRITLVQDWNGGTASERQFLRVVQESACKRFGTVLGPEYNAAHADHFHLESGRGSFCR
ncbi:extensin family protein [Qipengyuania sp. JC766]|uniref:extensin family protein n=1 Tax=Qipengyuania sp. JC766 TaxID=3232139 RepID=UPI003459B141